MMNDFEHEYDLDSLILVSPRDRDFSMYVTPRYRSHYEGQSYERFSANLLAGILNRAKLFVDVGAHYGFFTLLAATRHPQLEILAFEPVPETAEVLRRNVSLHNLQNTTVRQMAVSSTEGFSAMWISQASDNCGFHVHPAAPPLRQMNLPTTTLDAVLAGRTPGPTVVKIDTEGHELAILAGMADTLKRFPDLSLLIKFNPKMQRAAGRQPEELLQELDQLGLVIFLLDDRQGLPFRLMPNTDWTSFMSPQGGVNLYCVRNDRALSVCFFSHSAELAGAERSLLELVTDLVHNEGTVCSVVVPSDGPLVSALTQAGAACLVSSYGWWCDWRCYVSSAILAPDTLKRLRPDIENLLCKTLPTLARVNPDVIQTQTMVIPWGAVAAALLNKPHVWSIRESGEYFKFFAPLEKILQDIINSSAFIYTCSDTVGAALFPELGTARRRTLYPHIYLPDTIQSAKTSGCFTRNGAVHLGVFGTLQKNKGQEDAVRALARLVERGRDAELLLAGWPSPDYRAELQVLIDAHGLADRVRIPGFLADPFSAMRETDIVLACSRNEPFGRTVVEAMLLGKPVIYAAAGGFLETMADGQTGLSYPPGDAAALAARIEMVLDDSRRAVDMVAAARAWAAERFNRSTVGRDVFPTFQSLRRQPPHLTPMPAILQAMVCEVMLERLGKPDATACEQQQQELLKEARQKEETANQAVASLRQQNEWLTQVMESAQQWQRQSRFKRAFHRWCPLGTPRNKAGLLRRWERSVRKRRKQLIFWWRTKVAVNTAVRENAQTGKAHSPGSDGQLAIAGGRQSGTSGSYNWLLRLWDILHPSEFTSTIYHQARLIQQSGLFDPQWYQSQDGDRFDCHLDPVVHYLLYGARAGRNPNPFFDNLWYLKQNPDVVDAGLNPLVHYIQSGAAEGRDPSPDFNIRLYLQKNPGVIAAGIEPLTHFLTTGVNEGRLPNDYNLIMEDASVEAISFGTELGTDSRAETIDLRAIAFYLPQFHPIPDNDAWWGKDFTEWMNVRRGKPQFQDHYQPHVPHPDIGYYDLRDASVLERQAMMARKFGIHGFCFYHYWFGGKRLLEMPVERMLQTKRPDFPFCLCWANENWTRRWDGSESETLIAQQHSADSDDRFIWSVLQAFRDPRYIKIDGRPLLLVYRPPLLSEPKRTFQHWRKVCRKEGIGEIFLVGVQTFGFVDPRPLGMDAVVEFPPHNLQVMLLEHHTVKAFDHFQGQIFNYHEAQFKMLHKKQPPYTLFRGVMLSWDNTARLQKGGTIFINSNPKAYYKWLQKAAQHTRTHNTGDRQLLFINAWNEWAEGCHLEPDCRHGYAYLQATFAALRSAATPAPTPPVR